MHADQFSVAYLTFSYAFLRRLLWLISFLIVFFVAGTGLYHHIDWNPSGIRHFFMMQLSLAHENVAATWFSSMLLLFAGILSCLCYLSDINVYKGCMGNALNWSWLFIATVFSLLSFDEMGSIHEQIGDTALFNSISGGSGWFLFKLLVIAVGIAMMAFSCIRLRKVPLSLLFFVIGVLLYMSNSFQEDFEIESMRSAPNPDQWKRPLVLLLLEEGSELAGSFCFILACIFYLKRTVGVISRQEVSVVLPTFSKKSFCLLLAAVITGGVGMLLVAKFVVPGSVDDGIPRNWFPAAISFLAFIACLYVFSRKVHVGGSKHLYVLIAFVSICFSLFAGTNLFFYSFVYQASFMAIMTLPCLASIYVAIMLRRIADVAVQILLAAWALLICACVFVPEADAALLIYGAFGSLLCGLPLLFNRVRSAGNAMQTRRRAVGC